MPKDYPRTQRVGDLIQRELSVLIRTDIKDPRLSPMLTIAEVRVIADLSHAKVYVTSLDERGEESVAILNHAAGHLRTQLSKRLRMRTVPALKFVYDTTIEQGTQLASLIDQAVKSDREKHKK